MIRALYLRIKDDKWLYLLVFLMILISDDSFWFGTFGSSVLLAVKYVFVAFLPVVLYVKGFSRGTKKFVPQILFMFLLFCATAVFSGSSIIGGPLMLICTIVAAIFIAHNVSLRRFANCFSDIVLLIIVLSLALWGLVMFGVLSINTIENVAGHAVKTCGFCIFFGDSFGIILRNAAFFREPGCFMVFIVIAFLLEITTKEKISIWRIAIYLLGMISTVSTAGIIIIAIEYMFYLNKQKASIKTIFLPLILIIVCTYFLMLSEEMLGNLFAKLQSGTDSNSTLGRISSITIPYQIILHNPLFGVGAEGFKPEYIKYGQMIYNQYINPEGLSTNTIFNAGAVYGLWFFVLLIVNLYRLSKSLARNKFFGSWLILAILLMTFSNESMFYSISFYLLVFYGQMYKRKILV